MILISAAVGAITAYGVAQAKRAANATEAKYAANVWHEFELGDYSSDDKGYPSKLKIWNAGEVPVTVQAEYIGKIIFDDGTDFKIGTITPTVVIQSGVHQQVSILLITDGNPGKAEMSVRLAVKTPALSRCVIVRPLSHFRV